MTGYVTALLGTIALSFASLAFPLFVLCAVAQPVPDSPVDSHRGSGRYQENPTMPGEGTPQRTEGSGTR